MTERPAEHGATSSSATIDANALPFVAPCRALQTVAPFDWLRLAWKDCRSAPRQTLAYGAAVVLLSWSLAAITMRFGGYWEVLALVTGFIFIAPLLAVGTYSISEQLERGERPHLLHCFAEKRRAFGNLMVFGLMLMVVFLVWWRAASAIYIFFPVDMTAPGWKDYLQFFGIGTGVGTIFAVVVFAAAAFSLPMLVDRDVDAVTAVVTSVNAVLRNKPAMLVWAGLIVLAVAPGFSLLFVGRGLLAPLALATALLGLTLPLIGHATWHGYRATVDASAWPREARRNG